MIKQNRIEWLDGLKGIACILIFVHHFLLLFYPAVYFGDSVPSHLNGVDTALAQSPFAALINGNFLVMIFCCVSGVVISLRVMQIKEMSKLSDIVAKRYLRLLLPIIPVAILVFALLRLNAFTNGRAAEVTGSEWANWYYNEPMTVVEFLQSVLSRTLLYGDNRISNAFWMLTKLFTGTFLSVLLSVISWKYRKRAWIIYVFVCVIFFNYSDFHFAFCLGTLLAWLHLNAQRGFRLIPGIAAIVIGLLLGSYPSGVQPNNFYKALDAIHYEDWHALGAVFTVYGIWSCGGLRKLLSLGVFRFLGKISYSVYILHIPLEFTLCSSFFLWTRDAIGYNWSVLLTFVISLTVLIGLSFVYNKFVERGCSFLQGKLFAFLEGKNKNKDSDGAEGADPN